MKKSIRALLLSGGYGTRLRPLTYKIPKCLVKIGGITLIERWLNILENIQCERVLINTHYMHEKVEQFILNKTNSAIEIDTIYEPKLLGTAGTLLSNIEYFKGGLGILIHADNYTETNLTELINAHSNKPSDCFLTMLTFNTDTPQSCGIVNIDEKRVVNSFQEKVDNPVGNMANGAVYVFDKDFIDFVKKIEPKPVDFSTEILPRLLGRIYTWHTRDTYIDIGTPENLNRAKSIVESKSNHQSSTLEK